MKSWLIFIGLLSVSVFAQNSSQPLVDDLNKEQESTEEDNILDEFKVDDGWSFNPLESKRDPFLAPDASNNESVSEILRYEIASYKLIAIATGSGKNRALFSIPKGSSFVLREGDVIGRKLSKIIKITNREVHVKTAFKDNKDNTQIIINKIKLGTEVTK